MVSVDGGEQSLDSYHYVDGDLDSIHHAFGETAYPLLEKEGFQVPPNWTLSELAEEVIKAEGDISLASEALQDLLTHQSTSWYFSELLDFIRSVIGFWG